MSRTLLLGLDGATFTLLDRLIEDGLMPFTKQLVERGVRAPLMSTPCPLTPPAWTSMMTGRGPGEHGIFDFTLTKEVERNRISARMTTARDVQSETIWSIVGRSGKKSGILNFPVTFLSRPFNGYLVPGYVTPRVLRTSVHPRELWDEISNLPGFDAKDVAWDMDVGMAPLDSQRMAAEDLIGWVEYLKRKDAGWHAVARYLLEQTPCDLVAVVFEGVDRLQHMTWDLIGPESPLPGVGSTEQKLRDHCYSYFRSLDKRIEDLCTVAGPSARVFIASDHGFGSTHEIFYVNAWLARNGYLCWKEGAGIDTSGRLTTGSLRQFYESIDWARTVAYASTATSNGIYLRVANNAGDAGLPPERYNEVRLEIMRRLRAYTDRAGSPVVTKIVTREEAFPGKAMDQAPDLTLTLRDGGFVSIFDSDDIVKPRPEIKGTHRAEGIFIANGHDIVAGRELGPLSILDVAPTLLYSLELSIPENLEGACVAEIFAPDYLRSHPIRFCEPTHDPEDEVLDKVGGDMDRAEEEVVLDRLKALGYMQ